MNFARKEDYLIILWLTTDTVFQLQFYSSDARLPISPATGKKQMQRLNLSPEKKKVEQDKKRLYMKICREAESIEQKTTEKDKK